MHNQFLSGHKAEDFYYEYTEDDEDIQDQLHIKPSNLKELPFEETKAMFNAQAKSQHNFLLMEYLHISPNVTISPEKLNNRKKITSPSNSGDASHHLNEQKKHHQFFNERNFLKDIANEEAAENKAIAKHKIQEQLKLIKKNVIQLREFIKELSRHENSNKVIFKQNKNQKKQLVDYILLTMGGISNKSRAYRKLRKTNYLTLLEATMRFLEKNRLSTYTEMANVQRAFTQYLYYRLFNKKKLHYSIFQETPHTTYTTQAQSRIEPEPSVITETHAPDPQVSILDRIMSLLSAIFNRLVQCFSCCRSEQEEEKQVLARP